MEAGGRIKDLSTFPKESGIESTLHNSYLYAWHERQVVAGDEITELGNGIQSPTCSTGRLFKVSRHARHLIAVRRH